jgi:F-type H+-transporting ATPase subunit beta
MTTTADERYSDNLRLFLAVRRGDVDGAAGVLDEHPELLNAEEDWTEEEAHRARTLNANDATALVRAAERDDMAMVRLLVERGADVNMACRCAGAESPMWLAVATRSPAMSRYLAEHGADVNLPAFAGHAPLHVAAMRGWEELVELLLDFGADPTQRDYGGRTPVEWAVRNGHRAAARLLEAASPASARAAAPGEAPAVMRHESGLIESGIKALDLFAPIAHGDLVRWDPGRACFHMVFLTELTRNLLRSGYTAAVWAGFEDEYVNERELMHALMELGDRELVTLSMGPGSLSTGERRAHMARVEARLDDLRAHGRVLVVVYQDGVQMASPETAFPTLNRRGGHEVTAICVTPVRIPARQAEPVDLRPPIDVRVAHDIALVAGQVFPAIRGQLTASANLTAERVGADHVELAAVARNWQDRYSALDPELDFPDPAALEEADRLTAIRGQLLHAFLTQPFQVAEPFSGMPGVRVPLEQTLQGIRRILTGELDEAPARQLLFRGSLD